jgi:hypothetical protein
MLPAMRSRISSSLNPLFPPAPEYCTAAPSIPDRASLSMATPEQI